jgi:acyl-CoA dehydrogenase
MDFQLSAQQLEIRAAVMRQCTDFGDDYWLDHDRRHAFPKDFYDALAKGGWLGIAQPVAYGGAGLGITEAAILMQAIAESGAGMSGASAIHMNIFGLQPVIMFGTPNQKQEFLPPLIAGQERACFAVTEANAGLNTLAITTKAELRGDHYVINGAKTWISTAQQAERMLILTRTTPIDQICHKTDGLTLFYTRLDRSRVEVREIAKMGRHAVDSNQVFIDNLIVPISDRIGAEGEGFKLILHGLNPERILIAAEAIGIGRNAINRAARYASERVVFDRPIGQNQAIQHPLAKCWAQLEAANLMVFKAADLYDRGLDCAVEANAAKYLAGEFAFEACHTAMLSMGGMGYAQEFHVERLLRESLIPRTAPVSPHLILSFLAEKVLGLPKSY